MKYFLFKKSSERISANDEGLLFLNPLFWLMILIANSWFGQFACTSALSLPFAKTLLHVLNLSSLFLSVTELQQHSLLASALHQGYFLGKPVKTAKKKQENTSLDVIELVKIPDMETKNWRLASLSTSKKFAITISSLGLL